jgi:hypothetical protein
VIPATFVEAYLREAREADAKADAAETRVEELRQEQRAA